MSAQCEEWVSGDGRAVLIFEPPDLVVSRFTGVVEVGTYQEVMRQLRAWHVRERRKLFSIGDMSRVETILPEARHWLVENLAGEAVQAAALVSQDNFVSRTLSQLIVQGLSLVGGLSFPMVYVSTEAEARAWLGGQRAKLAGRAE